MSEIIKEFQKEYRFLSNFYPAKITVDNLEYSTTEHYNQTMKFTDPKIQEEIRTASTPKHAKELAQKYKSEIREDWHDINFEIMEKALRLKFNIPELQERLIGTKHIRLQEGNYWNDTFWGVDLKTGQGENHLGKLLMKIRAELSKKRFEEKLERCQKELEADPTNSEKKEKYKELWKKLEKLKKKLQ